MNDYIIIGIFLLIVWLIIYRWHSAVRITYMAGEKKLNEDEEFVWVKFGGKEYPIQKEYAKAWNNLTFNEKKDWVANKDSKLKKGEIVAVIDEFGRTNYKTTEKDKQIGYHKDKYYQDQKFLK